MAPTNEILVKVTDENYNSIDDFIAEQCENHAEELKCEICES